MIEGGYYIKARKIQNSDISIAPPHVREIWDWLIKEVNHKDCGNIKRGQTVRTLQDIAEGLKWFVGYRKEMYSKSKCEMATNWLRKHGMITTMKTTRGMIITVCNYDIYQNFKNYETNNEKSTKTTRKKQPSVTINNEEESKDNKEIDIISFTNYFNSNCGDIPKIKIITDIRKNLVLKILKSFTKEDLQSAILNAKNSDFLQGKIKTKNHENWIADFDFIFNEKNFIKILEGKYNNRQSQDKML